MTTASWNDLASKNLIIGDDAGNLGMYAVTDLKELISTDRTAAVASLDSITTLQSDVNALTKKTNDMQGMCCLFDKKPDDRGKTHNEMRTCLGPGFYDLRNLAGWNDKVYGVHCSEGVKADLYPDVYHGDHNDTMPVVTVDEAKAVEDIKGTGGWGSGASSIVISVKDRSRAPHAIPPWWLATRTFASKAPDIRKAIPGISNNELYT